MLRDGKEITIPRYRKKSLKRSGQMKRREKNEVNSLESEPSSNNRAMKEGVLLNKKGIRLNGITVTGQIKEGQKQRLKSYQ